MLNLFEEEPWRAVAHDFADMLLNSTIPRPRDGSTKASPNISARFASTTNRSKSAAIRTSLLAQRRLARQPARNASAEVAHRIARGPGLAAPARPVHHEARHIDPTTEGTHHTLYYAESWIVMHYLLHEKKLPETGTYFNLVLNQHVPVEEAIQKAYGMSSAQLEQAVKDYFHAQTALLTALDAARQTNREPGPPASPALNDYRFPAPVGPDDSAITSKPLPEADERALYAEVEIRIPERRDRGLQDLHALATAPTAADKKFESEETREKTRRRSGPAPHQRDRQRSRPSHTGLGPHPARRIRRSHHRTRRCGMPSIRATCGCAITFRC